MWALEDARAQLYLARKSGDFDEVNSLFPKALSDWQAGDFDGAKDVLLYWMQADANISREALTIIAAELAERETRIANLDILRSFGKPKSVPDAIISFLWSCLGTADNPEEAQSASHALVLLLPKYAETNDVDLSSIWPHIVACISASDNAKHQTAGFRAWLACMLLPSASGIKKWIYEESNTYFAILQSAVAKASKFALQILINTLEIADERIDCQFMTWDPEVPGTQDAWGRFFSLCDILGVDTSMHQTEDTLANFVVLMSDTSPIPVVWRMALINIGTVASNSDGIKSLITNLIMHLKPEQMSALVASPTYTARTLYSRLLQTPNFVMVGSRCLFADNLEAFTRNFLKASLNHSVDAGRRFVVSLGEYFAERPHSYEAPRVLVMQAIVDLLPPKTLTDSDLKPFAFVARTAVNTYTSKAMADLFATLCEKLQAKQKAHGGDNEQDNDRLLDSALREASQESALSIPTFDQLKTVGISEELARNLIVQANPELYMDPLMNLLLPLQLMALGFEDQELNQESVQAALSQQLNSPRTNGKRKDLVDQAVELAFNYVHQGTSAHDCEEAFVRFSALRPRLAALRSFKRGVTLKVDANWLAALWLHIKEASVKIQDRELHHEFVDLLTDPELVESLSVDICFDIVELSAQRKNLLVPLARGVARFGDDERASLIMAKLFCFIRSEEYTIQLEELIADRYHISEQSWGEPELRARVIASQYLATHLDHSETVAEFILDEAKLDRQLSGSFDNIEARQRVLYYQTLILQQASWSDAFSNRVLNKVKSSLEQEASPVARVHAEWLIALISADHNDYKCPDFVLSDLAGLKGSIETPPRLAGSLIRIALLLVFSDKNASAPELGQALVELLLPLATSNKAAIRHRSISALYIISKANRAPGSLKTVVDNIASISEAGVQASNYQNEAFIWELHDTRLGPVCGGVASAVFDRTMGDTLMEPDLSALHNFDYGPCWRGEPVRMRKQETHRALTREAMIFDAVEEASTEVSSHVQIKSVGGDIENRARRTSLIVVATLCDKPVNLGAITRLSDALGVSLLTVRDTGVLKDTNFKSTALTAEKWIPIQQVTQIDLGDFLRSKKAEGYTLVGIEQTDTSVKLGPNLRFPEKTVLMMGHEREGIPAALLALLDTCVEIEQLGYVRSMNIQTATAVVVHAYNHQNSSTIQKVMLG